MRISRKVLFLATLLLLLFSFAAAGQGSRKITLHVQTMGYKGRDLLVVQAEITGEDHDSFLVTISRDTLCKIEKEINIERLPVVRVSETTVKVPKDYLVEISPSEFVATVPNDVARIRWNLRDRMINTSPDEKLRVIVMFKNGKNVSLLRKYGTIVYEFASGLGATVDIPASRVNLLSEDRAVLFLEDDFDVQVMLSQSVPLINADDVWNMGYDGSGVKICLIDTGIDPNHCDFPSGKIIAWRDVVNSSTTPYDDHGHGTHVASIAAGETSPKGVAPGASLMCFKAVNSSGSSTATQVIQGVDWGVYNGADIESLSIATSTGCNDGTSSMSQECNWAVDQGVVLVVAVGNGGNVCTIGIPGDAEKVITVSACDNSKNLASFCSRGPTCDDRAKPDVVAPGVSVYAADAGTSCSNVAMSGTSMSTPHVSGIVALMLDARPGLTPLQVKNVLGFTATDMGTEGKDLSWGWGIVDAYNAVNQALYNPNVTPPARTEWCAGCCGCLGTVLIVFMVLVGSAVTLR
ncbi:MAG: S8 family peptidase [Theionarchaea archaeon]|nr:S8 family peptidase [Theionarchaea archaeon]MBU7036749.1 S8 family peptidase [Theionarchaea archaeon]